MCEGGGEGELELGKGVDGAFWEYGAGNERFVLPKRRIRISSPRGSKSFATNLCGRAGGFAAPPPGQNVDKPLEGEHLELGEKVEDLHHPIARQHFRVIVIKPDEVESVDLSDPAKSRRQRYKFDSQSGEWSHEETWP